MNLKTLAIIGLVLSVPGAAAAQEHKCKCCAKGGHEHNNAATPPASHTPDVDPQASAAPAYDLASEVLIAGVIHSVMRHPGMDVQLTIGLGERNVEVLVAPMAWLDAKRAVFRPGERIEVVGSTAEGNRDLFVARELHTTDQTVIIRDSEGRPLWN
jgi:hypothetical protein